VPTGNNFRLKISPPEPIFPYVEDTMTEQHEDSRQDDRRDAVRPIASRRLRLTPERTAEIRLRILERAYDSPQIAATIARRLLQRGEL
jgi:hypothetical protein